MSISHTNSYNSRGDLNRPTAQSIYLFLTYTPRKIYSPVIPEGTEVKWQWKMNSKANRQVQAYTRERASTAFTQGCEYQVI